MAGEMTLRLSAELRAAVGHAANARGVKISAWLREAISEKLEREGIAGQDPVGGRLAAIEARLEHLERKIDALETRKRPG